jgi:hypothetical protein
MIIYIIHNYSPWRFSVNNIYICIICGRVAELVDALVLGTNSANCEGSSPFSPTNLKLNYESNNRK